MRKIFEAVRFTTMSLFVLGIVGLGPMGCGSATPEPIPTPRPCLADSECRGEDRICHEGRCRFVHEVRREVEAQREQPQNLAVISAPENVPTVQENLVRADDMFMGDARHTGRSPFAGPRATPNIAFAHGIGGRIYGAPVVTREGLVAVVSTDRSVVLLEDAGDHGNVRFRHVGSDRFQGSPVVLGTGEIAVAGHDGVVVALSARGQIRWQRQFGTPIDSALTVALGSLFFSADGIVSLAEDGALRNRIAFAGARTAISVRDDGEACSANIGGTVACFARDGSQRMRAEIGASSDSTPAIADDGTIYIGNDAGVLSAIAHDGTVRFRVQTGGAIRTTPAIGADGSIYFGSDDRTFYGLNPNGEIRFRLQTGGRIRSSARIDRNEILYFGSQDDFLYAVTPAGEVLYRVQLSANVDSTPCLAPNGTLYVGTDAGTLVALRTP